MPNSMIVNLDYHDVGTYTASLNTPGYVYLNQWRTNSIFDPDLTGVGHQPRYHDQWTTLYRKYYVRKCHVTIRVHTTTPTADSGGYMFLEHRAANDPSKLSSTVALNDLLERAKSSGNRVSIKRFSAMNAGRTMWFSAKKSLIPAFDLEGRDKHESTGVFGANPTRVTLLDAMWVFPQRTANLTFFFETDIKYEVILMDPIMPGIS